MNVEIEIFMEGDLPEYALDGDAGMDIRSTEAVEIRPGETVLLHTGIYMKIPRGFEIQVRPRSGLSYKTKMRIANAPGTIDSNYLGELCVITDNISESEGIKIKAGDRIAQIVAVEIPTIVWNRKLSREELGTTNRGEAGFGSTGTN